MKFRRDHDTGLILPRERRIVAPRERLCSAAMQQVLLGYGGVPILTPPALHGSPQATAGDIRTVTNLSVNITTTVANTTICVLAYNEAKLAVPVAGKAVSSVAISGLTFTKKFTSNGSSNGSMELWTAPCSGTLTAQSCTVTWPSGSDDGAIVVWALSGAGAAVFDTNASMPAKASSNVTWTPSFSSLATDAAGTMLVWMNGGIKSASAGMPAAPTGYTSIASVATGAGFSAACALAYYKTYTSVQSGLTVTASASGGGDTGNEAAIVAFVGA